MLKCRPTSLAASAAVLLLLAGGAMAGPEWNEAAQPNEAGSTQDDAQTIEGGPATVMSIRGELSESGRAGDYEDMYRIYIWDPDFFLAATDPEFNGNANFDTQLHLFDNKAFGLLSNDNSPANDLLSVLPPLSNDGTNIRIPKPGVYLLAISGFDNVPMSLGGQSPIFAIQDRTEVSGPDGDGGQFVHDGWSGPGAVGQYLIHIRGVMFVRDCPGDFNNDGVVDFFDVALFLELFFNQDSGVDFNGDGLWDFFDVDAFLRVYNQPCQSDG